MDCRQLFSQLIDVFTVNMELFFQLFVLVAKHGCSLKHDEHAEEQADKQAEHDEDKEENAEMHAMTDAEKAMGVEEKKEDHAEEKDMKHEEHAMAKEEKAAAGHKKLAQHAAANHKSGDKNKNAGHLLVAKHGGSLKHDEHAEENHRSTVYRKTKGRSRWH